MDPSDGVFLSAHEPRKGSIMGTTISTDRYIEATEGYEGWCTTCEEFTRESTEPDAEEYDCPACGEDTVMGAEQALLVGAFDISAPNEPPIGSWAATARMMAQSGVMTGEEADRWKDEMKDRDED
jgi:hypothetical protein